jgi:GH24 family phage-related lysozyme (muramidase)
LDQEPNMALMKTSLAGVRFIEGQAGLQLIEGFEGLILSAYDDYNDHVVKPGDHIYGTLTIGYGHTNAAGPPQVYPGMTITLQQAQQILAADLASVEANVNMLVKVPINQNQFDALVSFDFNTGALNRSNVLRAINSGQFKSVRPDLLMWVYGNHQLLQGLVRRRIAEANLFEAPVQLAKASAPQVTVMANAILKDLDAYVTANVPAMFGFQAQALALTPSIAGLSAADAYAALLAWQAAQTKLAQLTQRVEPKK